VQYVFLWASGAPNSRAAPGSPNSSYATAFSRRRYVDVIIECKQWKNKYILRLHAWLVGYWRWVN